MPIPNGSTAMASCLDGKKKCRVGGGSQLILLCAARLGSAARLACLGPRLVLWLVVILSRTLSQVQPHFTIPQVFKSWRTRVF